MAILNLIYYPDSRLRNFSKPVKKIDEKVKKLVSDMFETMYFNEGIGLAAPQVGINLEIITINLKKKKEIILINPKIIDQSSDSSYIEEGCLSIPDQRARIKRNNFIKIEALNILGKKVKFSAKSLLSICIQHEIDHLKGKLFIDYLSEFKKKRIKKKMLKLNKFNTIKK
ncbi:Peptide deformylase [Buchnera aphidicola (Tetraneura ulmi)]|uniref:peptide deformylase n=1 Tax=Buchnera aphidicola TaxID=9 RepID=UPI003463C5E4